MNKVILVGRLGKDAEHRTFDNGNSVINFTMATSERYKKKDGEIVENTEWHNVAYFSKSTKIAGYLLKGTQVAVEGKIKTRSWDDNDGNKKYTTEVVINDGFDGKVMLLSKPEQKEPQKASNAAQTASEPTSANNAPVDDDLPF